MLKKLLVIISVFGVAFFLPSIANADTTHTSARIVADGSGYVDFHFGIVTIPNDLIPDTDRMFSLTSPNCGGSTGSGLPAINCGDYAPFVRFCSQKDGYMGATPGTLNNSVRCFYSLVVRRYEGGSNLNQFYASQFSVTDATGHFDNNFNLVGDNYYAVNFDLDPLTNSDCKVYSTASNCTYWVEYYNGTEYIPYAAVGVNIPVINKASNGSAYWTPNTLSEENNNSGTDFFSNCNSVPSCFGHFFTSIINTSSVFGQAKQIYEDFFLFKTSDGVLWKDVNPLTSNCSYSQVPTNTVVNQLPTLMNPAYNTAGGMHPATAVCCVGPLFQVQGVKIINSTLLTNPVDQERINNFLANDYYRNPHYYAPFSACSGKLRDISQEYVLPITSALIYISFAFFLAKLVLSIFSLDSTNPNVNSQVQGFIRRRKDK